MTETMQKANVKPETPSSKAARRGKDLGNIAPKKKDGTLSTKTVKVFSKESPEYEEFVSLVAKNNWTDKLPITKKSKDLSDFMEKTGFVRAQAVRKFNEIQKWKFANLKEATIKPQNALESEEALQAPTKLTSASTPMKREPKEEDESDGPKAKRQKKKNITVKDGDVDDEELEVPQESNVFSLPPIRLSDFEPARNNAEGGKKRSYTPVFIPGPPALLPQISSSAFCPLRTSHFHDIAPPSYHVTLALGPSSGVTIPGPPALARIETGEVDQLLKGQLMPDPDHDPSSLGHSSGVQSYQQRDSYYRSSNHNQDGFHQERSPFFPRRRNSFLYHQNTAPISEEAFPFGSY